MVKGIFLIEKTWGKSLSCKALYPKSVIRFYADF